MKGLGCHAGHQEVSRCRTAGDSNCMQVRNPPWLESQGTCHQKSNTGVSVSPQKGLMSSNFLKKKCFCRCMMCYPLIFAQAVIHGFQIWCSPVAGPGFSRSGSPLPPLGATNALLLKILDSPLKWEVAFPC